jgi:hypothetical protein
VRKGPDGGPRSTLEVFAVDAASGITKQGSIDHSAFFTAAPSGWCGGTYGIEVRRGLFLEDLVYSVSYGGIVVSDTNDLAAAPEATLALPPPADVGGACPVKGL